MPPRQRQQEEEADPSSPAACSLLDLVAPGPVEELIWSGLDSEDRQRLRETCRSLRGEVERSCTALKPKDLRKTGEAGSLVKLSGLPRVRTLHLTTADAVQALSLDPPPSAEQRACVLGTSAPLIRPALYHEAAGTPLAPCLQRMRSVSRASGRLSSGPPLAYFPQLEDLRVDIETNVRG
jgi:hypothetical protein